jgi:hypothetical protein
MDIVDDMTSSSIGILIFAKMKEILELNDPRQIKERMVEINKEVQEFLQVYKKRIERVKDPKTKNDWQDRSIYFQTLFYTAKINEHLMKKSLNWIKTNFKIPLTFETLPF